MQASLHPSVVLAAYAEPWLRGARVAVLGSAALDLPRDLVARGARLVHVYDPVRVRVAEALARGGERAVVHAVLPDDGDLGVRDGAFDVVIVPDLAAFHDAAWVVALARRVLSTAGVALLASPNPDAAAWLVPSSSGPGALGYYDLFDAVSLRFGNVRMLGQVPFVGYAVVDFAAEGEPDVTVDTSALEGSSEIPEWYVVVAGQRRVETDAFALVELPLASVLGGRVREAEPPPEPPAPALDAATVERIASLEAEVASLRAAVDRERAAALKLAADLDEAQASEVALGQAVEETDTLRAAVEAERRRVEAKRLEAEELAASFAEAHAALAEARAQAATAKLERDALAARHDDAVRERAAAIAARDRAEADRAKLAADRDDARAALAHAEERHREELGRLGSLDAEIVALEARVRERGHRVADLERDVERLRVVGRELVHELAARPGPAAAGADVVTLRAHVDRLAADAARREADLAAASWRVALLERRSSGKDEPAGG